MKKTILTITVGLLSLTASCTYYTNSGNSNYSSKGACVPIIQPAPVVVQPVVEPVRIYTRSYFFQPVIAPPRCYSYLYID